MSDIVEDENEEGDGDDSDDDGDHRNAFLEAVDEVMSERHGKHSKMIMMILRTWLATQRRMG